jgi:hypothetical protein
VKGAFYQMIPFASHLPSQFSRDIKRAVQIRDTIFPPEFRAHLESYQPNMIRDLTDSLISAFKKEILKENGNDDVGSLQDIPALMSGMFEAAAATTSLALTWFILYSTWCYIKMCKKKFRRSLISSWEKIACQSWMMQRTCRTYKLHCAKF